MATSVNLETLLSERPTYRTYASPEAAAESNRRNVRASGIAMTALRRLHKADYDQLYEQAKAKINAERGPLPE